MYFDDASLATSVSEPSSLALLGMGLGLPFYFWRRNSQLAHSLTKRPLDMVGWLLVFENKFPKSNHLSREGLRSLLQSMKRFQITELNLSRRGHRPESNPPASHPGKQHGRLDCRRSRRPRPGS